MDAQDKYLALAKHLRAEGADLEATLRRLRDEGATIIQTLKVIRLVENVSLGIAKDIVDSSITWADRFHANDQLRAGVIEALEREAEEPNYGPCASAHDE